MSEEAVGVMGVSPLLQRLREGPNMPLPWRLYKDSYGRQVIVTGAGYAVEDPMSLKDQEAVVAAMNALPAVVARVEAAQDAKEWMLLPSDVYPQQVERLGEVRRALRAALVPFAGSAPKEKKWSWFERPWLYNRETGEPWKSTDPPDLIEEVPSDRVQAYEMAKLRERVKRLEDAVRAGSAPDTDKETK